MQAFDWDYLAGCHQLAPQLVLAALGDKELTAEKLDQIAKTGARIVAWEDKFTDCQHDRRHPRPRLEGLGLDGRRSRSGSAQLVRAKIDGIITNRPAQTRQTIERRDRLSLARHASIRPLRLADALADNGVSSSRLAV